MPDGDEIFDQWKFGAMYTVLLMYFTCSLLLQTSSQCHPRIHSVWSLLFDYLRGTKEWAGFWSIVIDGNIIIF